MFRWTPLAAAMSAAFSCATAQAQTATDDTTVSQAATATPSVTVRGHYDNAVGTSDAASQGVINAELLKSRPALRPGEVLEFVPGLIVTQHAGDGKANQYFLRGFNLDHGTDFATSVDGIPVNMPTHAHGQGYTDLNFLMPDPLRDLVGAGPAGAVVEQAGTPALRRGEIGMQLRQDCIHVGLFDSVARRVTSTTRDDQVRETMLGVYGQTALQFTPTLRGVFGLRADQVHDRVDALTDAANGGSASAAQLSPKLTLVAGPFAKTEFFFNAGRGFHSNDARGTTITRDPKNPDPATNAVDKVPALVASRGLELGARTEALPGLQSSLALWTLKFGSELVYVGDAGATEASSGSRRRGVEFNNRWTPRPWLLLDADFAWTHARFDNGDHIPNSVDKVASVALTLREIGPWSASLQWRYLGSGPLTEDNSVRSFASLTTNLRLSRKLGPKAELSLDVFNLLDRKVDDIQYFYTSQPRGLDAADDRHVHPAEPRSARLALLLRF